MTATAKPVLSLFPGVGLLDLAFELEGFWVLRGPDLIFGSSIRGYHARPGVLGGIIGGPPCQDFSLLRRCAPSGEGVEMLGHFARVVTEDQPEWFLMENVPCVPSITVEGYHVQRFNLAAKECGAGQSRLRCFQFGNRLNKNPLVIRRSQPLSGLSPAPVATEGRRKNRRSWADFCELQGLPRDFDLPAFTKGEKYKAVGNGVPIQMGRVLAGAINTWSVTEEMIRVCVCDCGRPVRSGKTLATAACRKRMERRRRDAAAVAVSSPGTVTATPSLF
jgi:DNA (cytosine-5)-methyltransferase 1